MKNKKAVDFAALIKLTCLKIFMVWESIKLSQPLKLHKEVLNPAKGGMKFLEIDDSPQKIALGLGVGVFLGILPGTGPIAAVILASILRINKASALLGSLLVNTWINIVTFVFAIKIGSVIIGINWRQIYNESLVVFSNFRYNNLLKLPVLKLILPTLIGYFIIAFFMGFFAYVSAFLMLNFNKKRC